MTSCGPQKSLNALHTYFICALRHDRIALEPSCTHIKHHNHCGFIVDAIIRPFSLVQWRGPPSTVTTSPNFLACLYSSDPEVLGECILVAFPLAQLWQYGFFGR
eukprot:3929309-Amphidinium_carterae.2